MSLKYNLEKTKLEDNLTYWCAEFSNGATLNIPVQVAKNEEQARAYIDENYSTDPAFTISKKEREALLKANTED